MPEEDTQRLRAVQEHRAADEAVAAERAPDPEEEHLHARRADRAAYLRDRLAERERSEREGG